MLQKTNTVFVGKEVNTSGSTLAVGDVVLIDASTGMPVNFTDAVELNELQIGLVSKIGNSDKEAEIKRTQTIARDKVLSMVYDIYSSKDESEVKIDFSGATIVPGYRYVVRLIYKDLYQHPGQFTHSYESIATGASTTDSICTDITNKINNHKGARSTAEYNSTTGVITVTAKEITANSRGMAGKEGISPYSQVQMTAVVYHTIPGSAFSSGYRSVDGVGIEVTPSSPGKGNPYVIRDREQAALAYKGITYRTTWPIIKPELNVNLDADYDEFVIEFSKSYQSPDNQYVKSTDLAAEVYVPNSKGLSNLKVTLAAWAFGK